MPFDVAFLELMPATIEWRPHLALDHYADQTFGEPRSCRARIEPTEHRTYGEPGETIDVTVTIYVAGVQGIRAMDKVTLPDGETMNVLTVITAWDENGPHHEELTCG